MTGTLVNTVKFLLAGVFIIVGLFLLSFLLSSTEMGRAQAKERGSVKPLITNGANSPNVVTSGITKAVNGSVRFMDSTIYAISDGIQTAASTTAQVGTTVARGVQTGAITAVRGVGNGLVFTARAVGTGAGLAGRAVEGGVSFVVGIPGDVVGFVANTPVMNAALRPADHEEVPLIDPDSVELQTALSALPPAKDTSKNAPKSGPGPQWPIHGRVTTEFGVDHWPFQRTHTGMDISSGRSSPIKPFRPGKVVNTVFSNRGLGNHVIVDHGNGVTSVYAHLSSISVREGQQVSLKNVLGIEGTTGVSTGTHLHLEIRVNGQAADPRKFISGRP